MKNPVKILVTLALIISIFFNFNGVSVNAETKESVGVAPVKNVENLSDWAIDYTLSEMKFSQDEINKMSDNTKKGLVSAGGTKADYDAEVKQYYTSLDGTRHLVTDENRDEIERMKKSDLATYNSMNQKNSPSMLADGGDSLTDGILSVNTYVSKTTSSNSLMHEYIVFFDWTWNGQPWAIFNDQAAISWDNNYTGVSGTTSKYLVANGTNKSSYLGLTPKVYGLAAEFPVYSVKTQVGGMSQHIRVPKTQNGLDTRIIGCYVHSLSPMTFSLSIGPASIEPSGGALVEEFYVDMNVRVGNSYY